MRDRKYRYFPVLLLVILLIAALPVGLYAEEDTEVSEESAGAAEYAVYIGDEAELLTDEEEEELCTVMLEGTAYGNMVFMTVDDAEGYKSKD